MNQIKTRQICLFFIAFLPITKFFMLPSILAETASENMWISSIISFLMDLLTVLALIFVCRKANTNIYELLEINFGKVGKNIILVLYLIFFLSKSILPINEQKEYIRITFYETMPSITTFLPFFVVSFYFCIRRKKIIGRCADIMWISTILGVVILFALSFPGADFDALRPILARGVENVFLGAYRSSNW
ncbi:MAG: GerAB/ArcD/ProY family transporter, partial [Clostridia bacterium]|nr:GerAB/ArcD/ProY family transporter [Clostridia bacterium]